jgi:hypothetical protein
VFNIVEKSSKFFLETIPLVTSATKMGSVKVVIFEGRSVLYILRKAKALKLTPGELHNLLLPILRKVSLFERCVK